MVPDPTADRFEIRQFACGALLPYLKREEVEGYCRNCEKYGESWSCPPHRFDPEQWFGRYASVALIARVMHVESGWTQELALEQYFRMTRRLNDVTRGLEVVADDSVCLYAGQCDYCEPCARTQGKACRAPELCRYSLESLGFKVSDVMSELLGLPLQWSSGELPERFIAVSAWLSTKPYEESVLRERLEAGWLSDFDIQKDDQAQ